jgi:hypothetical protein
MTLPLDSLTRESFAPFVGRAFIATSGDARIELELSEVKSLGHKRPDAAREPYSLTFRGAPGLVIPQGIHHMSCDGFGEIEMFITQNAGGPGGSEFEAIFT